MLSLEGRIIIFKTLTISKNVILHFWLLFQTHWWKNFKKFQKLFIWHSPCPKISHKTLCNNSENGGLKHLDIFLKIISLQCPWLRKLCGGDFHEWKIVPSHVTNKYFRKSFKFHSCLPFGWKLLIKFSEFYRNIYIFSME